MMKAYWLHDKETLNGVVVIMLTGLLNWLGKYDCRILYVQSMPVF